MMTKVLQLVAVAGVPTMHVGRYVRQFDPDGHDGRGDLVTTADIHEALTFPSAAEAMMFWQSQSKVRPLRADGKPNRPLTAFTVAVVSP